MFEDSWYSYGPESRKDDVAPSSKHRRRQSLLKQSNGDNQISDAAAPLLQIFEDQSGLKGPPQATLARRAKSYSDFYEAAVEILVNSGTDKPKDVLEIFENGYSHIPFGIRYKEHENDLLDASQDEYQLYRDQLALSERHLDSLLDDTSSALDVLATLSQSFKKVELQTTLFQAQCEDLLAEQKQLRDLADDVGTDLQYYALLEPLTRRVNGPGASRLVRSGDDFLDMLTNLNTCIDFMDQHPEYRDSSVYKARYISLLQRCLNMVQSTFITTLKEVTDKALEQLKSDNLNETQSHILLYGNFEDFLDALGSNIQHLLRDDKLSISGSVAHLYKSLSQELTQAFIRSRYSLVSPQLLKALRQTEIIAKPQSPESDFQLFARRCVLNVFEFCLLENALFLRFFLHDGRDRIWSQRAESVKLDITNDNVAELDQIRKSYIDTLYVFLEKYLKGDLVRICNLITYLESTYLGYGESEEETIHKLNAIFLLSKHLWPLCDLSFIEAAKDLQRFRPSAEDLKIDGAQSGGSNKSNAGQNVATHVEIAHDPQTPAASVSTAYPTVKSAVHLLILYNEGTHERNKSDVVYEIVDQARESLESAANAIRSKSGSLKAQLFLIKNLMLIRNIFLTHEIPESIRESPEFDFSPIWATIGELQAKNQLFNPLAYLNPLIRGHLMPKVQTKVLNARKKLEDLLAHEITEFTNYWKGRLTDRGQRQDAVLKAHRELEEVLDKAGLEEFTKEGLWKIIRAEDL